MTDTDYMILALEEANEGAKRDEVPVGAIGVWNGEIIARAHNRKEEKQNAIAHAEMEVLEQAAKRCGNWYLDGLTVYVTLEPCPMCAGAMLNARIKRLVFGAYDPKGGAAGSKLNLLREGGFNHTVEVAGGVMQAECGAILTEFFRKKRRKLC